MDSYAFLLLFPWRYAQVNYYWIHLIKQYGDTSKWENIYFPAVVLELFFFSLYKISTWLCLKFRVTSHIPGFLSRLLNYLPSPPPSSLPFNPCPPALSLGPALRVVFAVSVLPLLRACRGLPPMFHDPFLLSVTPFLLVPLDSDFSWPLQECLCRNLFVSCTWNILAYPFTLKKNTKKFYIYKKSWKNSRANTHVHLDSPINTFHICFVFLTPSFLARINIKWLLLFVEPFESNLQTFRHFTPKYSNI